MMILIVDTPEKVTRFLPELSSLVTQGLILIDEVNVVHHAIRGEHPDGPGARPVTSAEQHQRDQGSE
jgi:hypothetical protein